MPTLTQSQQWYRDNREKQLQRANAYYHANRVMVLAKKRAAYVKRAPELRERSATWYQQNVDKVRAYRRTEHYKSLSRQWYKKNPEKRRKTVLKQYGITPERYEQMKVKQNGKCAICKKLRPRKSRWGVTETPLLIDHCGKTGVVRGLLCHHCNAGLGLFDHDPEVLLMAVAYLHSSSSPSPSSSPMVSQSD